VWTELRAQGALDEVGSIETHVAAELSICMDVAQGTKPRPYGALVTLARPPATVGRLLTSNLDDEELRRVAEGRSLLVCRSRASPRQLLQLRRPLHTDADWEALVGVAAGVLVRIDVRGRIWVVGPRTTSCVDGRETWTRPHMRRVVDALTSAAPAADPRTLEALARLAYSHVSPAPVGATLVYQLTRSQGEAACFSGVTLDALRLNLHQAAHLSGILHQIEHRDGAVIFDRNGMLRRAGVILVPSASALEAVGAIRGGTRHHSAAWHSYDRPDVICFVVSKAGRVTVFSRGENVSPTPVPTHVVGHRRRRGRDAFEIS
jgi:hypothetical protein